MRTSLLLSFLVINVLAEDWPPVTVSLYYESLCPFSRLFVLKQLYPTFNKISTIMQVELIPYGNAHYKIHNETGGQFDVIFTCQHGPDECVGNQIQSCALESLGSALTLNLVSCMFGSDNWTTPEVSGPECSKKLGLDWDFLNECSSGPLGRGIELLMAEKTDKLNPPHTSVPWIVVNGIHTNDIEAKALNNLTKLVCDTYTGTKPKECDE